MSATAEKVRSVDSTGRPLRPGMLRRRREGSFLKVTTAGAGTMGSQVAWQMAFHGKHVTAYDAIPAGLEKGKALHLEYADGVHDEHFGSAALDPCEVDSRNYE